jgi:hypothetical protein
MRRLTAWFKNLKKWQKGGLIGCAVGLFFVCLTTALFFISILTDTDLSGIVLKGILSLHFFLFITCLGSWIGCAVAMVVLYGGFGAIVGRVQQVTSPFWRWLLTALLAVFLLVVYSFSFILGWWFE